MTYDDPDDVPAIWQLGDVILGKYEVKQVFTGGGMGVVYRVYHRDWDMDLAVKSPRPAFFETEEQIESFEREAENWVNLGLHPNVVSCFYVRRLGLIPRIFSEFVEGGSLSEWVRKLKSYEVPKGETLGRIIDVAIQFARGLQYAHQKGLIHQDVKPANVLMTSAGIAKVNDFGLARARPRATTDARAQSAPGQTIMVAGSGFLTPQYASPEQANGLPLSRKTDVWSWAVSILEMLKGDVDWSHGQAAPYVLQDFYGEACSHDPVARLLTECLEPDPRKRPADFQDIIERLLRIHEVTTGEKYPRAEPQAGTQSSDVLNNYAVSLLDLGRLFSDSGPGQRGAYQYFLELEEKDKTHLDGMLNKILMGWRHFHTPIHEVNRAVDNVIAMPGAAEELGLDWLMSFDLETLQTRRAIQTCARLGGTKTEPRASAEAAHQQVRRVLRTFFYALGNEWREGAQTFAKERIDADGEIIVSNSKSGLLCWVGATDDVCVWRVRDGLEVFRLTDNSLHIHAAGLSEDGTALVVMFIDERKDHGSRGEYYRFHIAVYDMTGHREEKILRDMEIPVGTIRLTVNNAGTAASVWVQPSWYPGSGWYQVAYNFEPSSDDFRWNYDGRIAAPIISSELICASGDGERLLVVREDRVQLWETSGADLRTCLLELSLSGFGLADVRNDLPGFDLDHAFEFQIDRWNAFDVLNELRRMSGPRRTPYRIARPQDTDQVESEQLQLTEWEKECAIHEQKGDVKAAIRVLDNCLRLRSAAKARVLEIRHRVVKTGRELYLSKCWHHRHVDEYWESDIMSMESEAEGETTLKRYRSIETENGRHEFWKPRISGWNDVEPYGFAILSEERALFFLTRKLEKRIALLRRTAHRNADAEVVWDLPLASAFRDEMYEQVVLTGKTLFRRDGSGAIVAHDVMSGVEKQRLTFNDSVSLMRRVVREGMVCLAVGTKNTGRVYVFNENAEGLGEVAVVSTGTARIEDVSRYCDGVIFSGGAHSLWHLSPSSGKTTGIWSPWENGERGKWDRTHSFRLSPCGRAVAYVFSTHLRVFDVATRSLVLNWRVPPRELVPPCFDMSGRWLTFAHSANKREVFELMWDVI